MGSECDDSAQPTLHPAQAHQASSSFLIYICSFKFLQRSMYRSFHNHSMNTPKGKELSSEQIETNKKTYCPSRRQKMQTRIKFKQSILFIQNLFFLALCAFVNTEEKDLILSANKNNCFDLLRFYVFLFTCEAQRRKWQTQVAFPSVDTLGKCSNTARLGPC